MKRGLVWLRVPACSCPWPTISVKKFLSGGRGSCRAGKKWSVLSGVPLGGRGSCRAAIGVGRVVFGHSLSCPQRRRDAERFSVGFVSLRLCGSRPSLLRRGVRVLPRRGMLDWWHRAGARWSWHGLQPVSVDGVQAAPEASCWGKLTGVVVCAW